MIGFGFSVVTLAVNQMLGFNPRSLFANGEQGWVYDPSNLSTLFQDAAGTTPVTAMEQPVGLQLDTRLGAPTTLGAELVTNGGFSSASNWNLNAGWSIGSGSANYSTTGSATILSQVNVFTVGKHYQVSFTITSLSAGGFSIYSGTGDIPPTGQSVSGNSTGTFTGIISAASTSLVIRGGATAIGSIDNISVRELPGNHRYQNTSANRPVVSARVSLLTKTEQFDDAVWSKGNATIGAGQALTRGPTNTTESLVFVNVPTQVVGTSITSVVRAKQGSVGANLYIRMLDVNDSTTNGLCVFDLGAGTVLSQGSAYASATINSDGAGGFICKVVGTKIATTAASRFDIGVTNLTSGVTGTSGQFVYLISADYRLTNIGVGLPAYQRVNTSTDYDTAGFPVYIKPNGSNQFMVTNSINFSATDKMTVWAGVRKLAADGIVFELSASTSTNNGAFLLYTPGTAYRFDSKGTAQSISSGGNGTSPVTSVLAGIGDISGDVATLRVNGAQVSASATDQGTGNYGNYPAYFYMRGGTVLPLNGHDYGSICRGSASSAAQITAAEGWINQRTKAF